MDSTKVDSIRAVLRRITIVGLTIVIMIIGSTVMIVITAVIADSIEKIITKLAEIVVLMPSRKKMAIQGTRSLIVIIVASAMIAALKIIAVASTRVILRRMILESAIQSRLSALKMVLVETRMELFLTHLKTLILIGVQESRRCLRA